MGTPAEETRRSFLLRLAAAATFVAPAMATVDVRPLLAQGGGGGKTTTSTTTTGGSTVGSLSPTAAAVSQPVLGDQTLQQATPTTPWDASGPAQTPPWARQPPGSGRIR